MKELIKGVFLLSAFVVSTFFICEFNLMSPKNAYGQSQARFVLLMESEIKIPSHSSREFMQKAEATAYLHAQDDGTFSGIGIMSISYSPQIFSSYSKVSEVKGRGQFKVKGVREGKNLRFWFERGSIPLKGTVITSTPLGTERSPYESTFDPAGFAVGKPGAKNGVVIELREGASAEVVHQNSGKTTFTLCGIEVWRVSVTGEEMDNRRPYIRNKRLEQELPIAVTFQWKLIGEFTIAGKGRNRKYLEGSIFSAAINPVYKFNHWNIYKCEFRDCPGRKNPDDLIGQPINGSVSGGSVQLKWPKFISAACVWCAPTKSYLGKIPYRQEFGTGEFTYKISQKMLPLVNGKVVRGGIHDWMRFTITLKKIF